LGFGVFGPESPIIQGFFGPKAPNPKPNENCPKNHLVLGIELQLLAQRESTIDADDYRRRFPDYVEIVNAALSHVFAEKSREPSHQSTSTYSRDTDHSGPRPAKPSTAENEVTPERVGRYEIRRVLGQGAFGRVYLALDPHLNRLVALKVPSNRLLQSGTSVSVFLAEARHAATLNHPGVVAVHDVQQDGDQLYIVQEFIDGNNLTDWRRKERASREILVHLLIEIAEAVGYAHQRDLIHRDLKPANILIDREGHAHVADFGLAIHESEQWDRAGEISGTPAYMSPEQVRGETHRLDGRTDIWSLGVILYELLVGRRPFRGKTRTTLFGRIQMCDARPPRQLDPSIPRELERICLKCLERRRAERYKSTADLIDDLRYWLDHGDRNEHGRELATGSNVAEVESAQSASPVSHIVPKGLRSFDASDADFFLELLPGPRDRDGLPDSIRFWKTRIEQTDPNETFSVGVLYGPSGCGKSSLVKAGLLPRLAAEVLPIYVEATCDDTEIRLLKKLAKHFPGSESRATFVEIVRDLRERNGDGRKVLIVLDQFEQWLHARDPDELGSSPLVDALRHCDGSRVQCIVLVRDDFWMAVTRFMRELEVPLLEGVNSNPVDLFPVRHAEEVLAKFGRAYGTLPDGTLTRIQQDFLSQSIAGLAEEGKVVCVRLALFAEMMKGKAWTPATLKAIGGAAGVGVTFLEETFSASTASPEHRYHQKAARAVLKALLPETGTEIKGHMRSYETLLEASGYSQRARDFDDLIRILDHEVRLITPTEKDEGGRMKDETKDCGSPSSFRLHRFAISSSPMIISFHRCGSG
jgi:serine/threonine protein kinase